VAAFTREDLEGHWRRLYGPKGATLVVAGDVTLEEVRQEAMTAFGDWDNPDVSMAEAVDSVQTASDSTTIYLVDKPGAAQSVIQAGHVTVPRSHPDYFRMVLLNFVFGGQFSARLNQNLRQDKGYSYGVHSSISWFRQPSALVVGGSVQTGVTKESVVEILKEYRDIHGQRPITREELDSAQAGMLQGLPAGFERPGQIMGSLVQMVLHDLPNDYFRTVGQKLSAVQLAEANGAGQERVDPDSLAILVVGDRAAIEAGLRELDLPLVILNDDGEPAG
jgi:zinc protease